MGSSILSQIETGNKKIQVRKLILHLQRDELQKIDKQYLDFLADFIESSTLKCPEKRKKKQTNNNKSFQPEVKSLSSAIKRILPSIRSKNVNFPVMLFKTGKKGIGKES